MPIYETSSADQIEWILRDSGARAVVAEGADHIARISEVRGGLDELNHVWSINDNAVKVLTSLGDEISDDELEQRRTAATPHDLATIIYTSGTTGRPKGCLLTHGNFMFELGVAVDELDRLFTHRGRLDAALPPARPRLRADHPGRRGQVAHPAGPQRRHQVACCPTCRSSSPTFILAVPRVFEKVFNTASQRATADGRGKIFDRAAETAIAYSRGLDSGNGRAVRGGPRPARGVRPPRLRQAPRRPRRRVRVRRLRRRSRSASGSATSTAASGSPCSRATASPRPRRRSRSTSRTRRRSAPSAGPIPGTAVRVADDGELLFRGGQVFAGYWRNDEATAEVLESDGWFHTGDVGEVDDEGFVRITGRKKEILVTAGGKNVAPAVLEDRLRAHPLVSQCMVVGDRQPFIAALVTIDPDSFPAWAEAHGKSGSIADLVDDPDLRAEIETAVDEANKAVSKAESIRKFRILPDDWTEEGGQLTPSLKLKRNVVTRECRDEIAALYV